MQSKYWQPSFCFHLPNLNIFTALSRTTLLYPDGYEKVVWSPDGNVAYLHGMHILLFITALLIGMIALPLVLVLTFIPCLQKKSDTPLLFWVTRLKPLFDAYTGPYKNTFRFWTGLLLLTRIVLFITSVVQVDRNFGLLVSAIASFIYLTLAWSFYGIYRKRSLDVLESSYILNIGLLSLATIYIADENVTAHNAVVSLSMGTAFTTFVGITIYHAYKYIKCKQVCKIIPPCLCWNQSSKSSTLNDESGSENGNETSKDIPFQNMPPVIHFDTFREPLFEYMED